MDFNPKRLSIARRRKMLNVSKFAEAVGVSRQAVGQWDRREKQPGEDTLDMIESLLGFPRRFFFGPDLDEPRDHTPSFRSQTCMSAGVRDAALAAGALGFVVSDWADSLFELPLPQVPNLAEYGSDPEGAARALREIWKLGECPVPNMTELLESKGVRVFSLAQNTAAVNAFSLWRRKTPFVFLNTFKSAESSRFDAAHELAHLCLHQDGKTIGREAEEQAQRFASSFLMPRSDVLAEIPRVRDIPQLIRAKARWRVSLAALVYRVHRLGLTSEWRNRDFCIEINRLGYRTAEPSPGTRERSVVWLKVIQSLFAEGRSHIDIARERDLPVSEVEDLLLGVVEKPVDARPTALRLLPPASNAG